MKTLGITYRLNHLVLSTILAVAAGSVSCGAASTPPASQVGATRAPVAPSAHGQIKVLGEALGDVPLTQPQRSEIDRLAQDAEARHAAVAAARRDLETALADQIEAGRLDRAALAPKIDAIVVSAQATQPPDRAAFERLHAILDSDQRTAFANAVEARVHERMGEGGGPIKHMKEWAEELKLTDDQRSQIGAMLKGQVEAARAHGQGEHGPARGAKILGAFKQDRFVFDEVAPSLDVRQRVGTMTGHVLDLAAQVVPILTPPQRTAAAQRLRSQPDSLGLEP